MQGLANDIIANAGMVNDALSTFGTNITTTLTATFKIAMANIVTTVQTFMENVLTKVTNIWNNIQSNMSAVLANISFAVCDENGLPRVYRRYGDALVSAVTQCKTKDVAAAAAEGASLMSIQTNDPRITLVAGGYPLFVNGRIAGGIGVGGGTEEQDCRIAEYIISVFEELMK